MAGGLWKAPTESVDYAEVAFWEPLGNPAVVCQDGASWNCSPRLTKPIPIFRQKLLRSQRDLFSLRMREKLHMVTLRDNSPGPAHGLRSTPARNTRPVGAGDRGNAPHAPETSDDCCCRFKH